MSSPSVVLVTTCWLVILLMLQLKLLRNLPKSEEMTFIDHLMMMTSKQTRTVVYEIYEQAQEEGVTFDNIFVPVGGGDTWCCNTL